MRSVCQKTADIRDVFTLIPQATPKAELNGEEDRTKIFFLPVAHSTPK